MRPRITGILYSPQVSECHPWRKNACCDRSVTSLGVLKNSFGASFHWDRCGPLSQACERFFVQEACFYEPWLESPKPKAD